MTGARWSGRNRRLGVSCTAALALAACSGDPKGIAERNHAGMPSNKPANAASAGGSTAILAFLDGNGDLSLTLWGSSSCPPVATRVKTIDAHAVQVDVDSSYPRDCTADLAPSTSVLELDDRVDIATPLRVTVVGDGQARTLDVQPHQPS